MHNFKYLRILILIIYTSQEGTQNDCMQFVMIEVEGSNAVMG